MTFNDKNTQVTHHNMSDNNSSTSLQHLFSKWVQKPKGMAENWLKGVSQQRKCSGEGRKASETTGMGVLDAESKGDIDRHLNRRI